MKITNVTAYHLPGTRYAWVFLHIDTDAGIHGLGQVSSGPNSAIVAAAASRLGPLLIGEDPSRIEYLWHKLYSRIQLARLARLRVGVDQRRRHRAVGHSRQGPRAADLRVARRQIPTIA